MYLGVFEEWVWEVSAATRKHGWNPGRMNFGFFPCLWSAEYRFVDYSAHRNVDKVMTKVIEMHPARRNQHNSSSNDIKDNTFTFLAQVSNYTRCHNSFYQYVNNWQYNYLYHQKSVFRLMSHRAVKYYKFFIVEPGYHYNCLLALQRS